MVIQVVKRFDQAHSFKVLPKRWIVERTFAWLSKYRRLSKDYEASPQTSEAMIYAAVVHLMARLSNDYPQRAPASLSTFRFTAQLLHYPRHQGLTYPFHIPHAAVEQTLSAIRGTFSHLFG